MNIKKYFDYTDWLSYFSWTSLLIVFFEFVQYYDTLVRWKWGYYSIDLIPAFLIILTNIFVTQFVLAERRWVSFKKLREEVLNERGTRT